MPKSRSDDRTERERERDEAKSFWEKYRGILATMALTGAAMQVLNTWGPCETAWKFETVESAQAARQWAESEHQSIRGEMSANKRELKEAVQKVQNTQVELKEAQRQSGNTTEAIYEILTRKRGRRR